MSPFPAILSQIEDRYRIEKLLGSGGFASVFLAADRELPRKVAIKLYHPAGEKESSELGREAGLLARLDHPNIVRIYDTRVLKQAGEDVQVLVMAYLSGGSLRERLQPGAPPMRPQDALGLVAILADALQAAHDARIVHLDIKPENILFDQKGRPYLTDFGIGRAMGGDKETRQTKAIGTNNYASPEQRQGGMLGPASDIYSLGVVLFEVLTNQLPLGPASVNPQAPYSPPFPIGHPLTAAQDLTEALCKALSVAPDYRFESATSFAQELRDYIRKTSSDTGHLARAGSGPFRNSPIAQVKIHAPERDRLRPEQQPRVPSVPELVHDLPPVSPHTYVSRLAYSHQALDVGSGALVEEGIFARGRVRLKQDAVVKGDVMSLSGIEVSAGVQANNLIAPEILVRGPIRLAGSIFCRQLRGASSTAEGVGGIHLPAECELGGSLIFGQEFEQIIPDDQMGRALVEPRIPPQVFHLPVAHIGTHCTLVALLGDVEVIVQPHQKQLNTIRVAGNVRLGRDNVVRHIEGKDVWIESDCTVDEVYARGKLHIGDRSTVGYARAGEGITLGDDVVISSPIIFADNGAITEEGTASWGLANKRSGELTARHIFTVQREAQRGSAATILLDHRLFESYERIAPGWAANLQPTPYEGTGDRVRTPAQPPDALGAYAPFPLDLTPPGDRAAGDELPDDLPALDGALLDDADGEDEEWMEEAEDAPPSPGATRVMAPPDDDLVGGEAPTRFFDSGHNGPDEPTRFLDEGGERG